MKKKSSTLRCTRFYCRMENLNDLVKEHLVVVKRMQVLLSLILINLSITTLMQDIESQYRVPNILIGSIFINY